VRRPLDLGDSARSAGSTVFLPPGFEERHRDDIGGYVPALLRVRTTDGSAGIPDAVRAARRIFGDSLFQVVGNGTETAGATDAIRVLSDALWIFAGVAAFAGLTAIGIVTFRQIDDEERDQFVLSTLGLTTRQRAIAAGVLGVVPAITGGVLAVVGAALASPLLPFGLARQAEPDPGFHVDALVLGLGLLAIVGFVLLVSAAAGWRVARSTVRARTASGPRRSSTASRISFRARTSPAMTTGLCLALEPGRGRLSVPVRTAFVGATIGTLGIVAVLVFGGSLDHLTASPRLYGWSWDASLQGDETPQQGPSNVCGDVTTSATKDRHFAAVAATCREGVEVAGHPATGWSFTSLKGSIEPVMVTGRPPATPDEVALGRELLDTAGKRVGDTVRVKGERSRRYRIVGQAVLPNLEVSDSEPVAGGVTFTGPGLMRIYPPIETPDTNILARLAPDLDTAALPRNRSGMWEFDRSIGFRPVLPVEVARIDQVDQLPLVLAGLLGLLAVVAVGHAVVLAIRRRRRELAVLRAMGFTSRDVRATIAYQATILTVLGLVVGIPLGLIVGRVLWRTVADGLGVAPVYGVSLVALAALALGALVLANLVGAFAANRAVHDRPAVVLADE
ncbi:MAG: FtsX-like permease family protein, partial [Acidimicrobiia bacterium]